MYLDLWDAFRETGCPVCTLVDKLPFLNIAEIQNNKNHHPEKIREGGEKKYFCNRHAWHIWNTGDSKIKSKTVERLLKIAEEDMTLIFSRYEKFLSKLRILRKFPWKRSPAIPLLKRIKSCFLCQITDHFEEYCFAILLNNITDLDFYTEFNRSDGICSLHLIKILEKFADHRNLPLLIRAQVERIRNLRKEISESGCSGASQGPEGIAINLCQKALELIAGKQGAFLYQMDQNEGGNRNIKSGFNLLSIVNASIENGGDDNLQDQFEKLKFEKEKLCRQNENLKIDYAEERSRSSSFKYNYWEVSEDNKVLNWNLSGARAQNKMHVEHIERLKGEIQELKETLKNREKKGCN